MPLPDEANVVRTRRRDKMSPDPEVRQAILAAASAAMHEHGVAGLSIAGVLDRAALSTRAFYRHFSSKDELVAAVFLAAAGAETRRLRRRMRSAATEIEAVAAWIDARLDLAFDTDIGSDLRRISIEAQSQALTPSLVQPAYAEMLKPLVEALRRGLAHGVFRDVDPDSDAQFIHGVVWAGIDRQWTTNDGDRGEARHRCVQFCLRGLGVPSDVITDITNTASG